MPDHGPFHHRTTGTYQLIKKLTRELADKIRLYERKIVVLQILLAQLEAPEHCDSASRLHSGSLEMPAPVVVKHTTTPTNMIATYPLIPIRKKRRLVGGEISIMEPLGPEKQLITVRSVPVVKRRWRSVLLQQGEIEAKPGYI